MNNTANTTKSASNLFGLKLSGLNLSDREKLTIPIMLVVLVLAAVVRTQPHISNITPFFAVSILVGFVLGRNRVALATVCTIAAMFAADLVLGLHWSMGFVYAGLAAATAVGAFSQAPVLKQRSWLARATGGFLTCGLASTMFFLISNLGVWLVGGIYPPTAEGLVACFMMAIPFFTKSLTADLFFGTGFILVASRLLSPAPTYASAASVKSNHGR